jgi:hypothetical protein
LPFESHTGNPFGERSLLIAGLDMVSRNDDLTALLDTDRFEDRSGVGG